MSNHQLSLTYLYPDSFNLHGDRGNILAFERVSQMMGLDCIVKNIRSLREPIGFDQTDVLFISPGELRTCRGVAQTLMEQQDGFHKFLNQGKTLIVIGTTISLFAKETQRLDGTTFAGLGLADITCKERTITYSNDLVYQTDCFDSPMQIVGGQIQMIDVTVHEKDRLGTVLYGYGNDHGTAEGYRKDGFLFTNALGPVMVKNPWLTEQIIRDTMKQKGVTLPEIMMDFTLEQQSNEAILQFIDLKKQKYDKTRLEQ